MSNFPLFTVLASLLFSLTGQGLQKESASYYDLASGSFHGSDARKLSLDVSHQIRKDELWLFVTFRNDAFCDERVVPIVPYRVRFEWHAADKRGTKYSRGRSFNVLEGSAPLLKSLVENDLVYLAPGTRVQGRFYIRFRKDSPVGRAFFVRAVIDESILNEENHKVRDFKFQTDWKLIVPTS